MLKAPAPFPVTYRELWLPPGINGNATLPSSVDGGHGLTLTGARKGTTCDGVHFDGTATSNINCGAIHNAAAKLWISLRFKLDQPFATGAPADLWLWGKAIDGNNYIYLKLENANGMLRLNKYTLAAQDFNLYSNEATWEAGVWYHILVSISSVNAVRMIVNNGAPRTDPDVSAICNGGDFIIGDWDDPGAGAGFKGIIADFFCGTDDLSQAAPDEEYDLYAGIPPVDVVNEYLLDEGRGVTAYDRGSGGNDGTLDTSATWAFGACQQPVLSLDGINDRATTGVVCNLSSGFTMVWVGKMKSFYNGLSTDHALFRLWVAANQTLYTYYSSGGNEFRAELESTPFVSWTPTLNIDDYTILLFTVSPASFLTVFENGNNIGTVAGTIIIPEGAGTVYLGVHQGVGAFDVSKPLFVSLIDGAFTDKQARTYSRWLDKVLNMGLKI